MKRKTFALSILLVAVFTILVVGYAEDRENDKLIQYKLLTTIDIPGDLTGFDISWVDSESGRYYLANRGNAAATPPVSPSISVIDTRHNKFLYAIPMSTGGNGVAAIRRIGDDDDDDDGRGTLVVGGTDSTAIFIDLRTIGIGAPNAFLTAAGLYFMYAMAAFWWVQRDSLLLPLPALRSDHS